MAKKVVTVVLALVLSFTLVFGAWACAKPAPEELPPIKVGLCRAFTGGIVGWGERIAEGVEYVFDEAGYEVAGRKIVLLQEDSSDTVEFAVAKVKKLVEQDKVDVVMGPLLDHQNDAVQAYLKPLGVIHLPNGLSKVPVSPHSFWTWGCSRSQGYPGGVFAYEELGARTASLIYHDYLFSWQLRDGFKDAFVTERGGKIIADIAVPFGEMDLAPYLAKVGTPDLLGFFFTITPVTNAFVKQFREYGLDMHLFGIGPYTPEAEAQEIGDANLGIYETTIYTAEIDSPTNKEFVKKFKAKTGEYPQLGTVIGYWNAAIYLEALKATGGDPDPEKIAQAFEGGVKADTPTGPLQFTPDRVTFLEVYIGKQVKKDRYCSEVVKHYPHVAPR